MFRIVAGVLVAPWDASAQAVLTGVVLPFAYVGCGALLIVQGKPQPAPMLLGGVFILLASSFVPVDRLLGTGAGPMRTLAAAQTGYFQPVFLWAFATVFPNRLQGGSSDQWQRRALIAIAILSGLPFGVGILRTVQPGVLPPRLAALGSPSLAWLLVYILSGITLCYVAYQSRRVRSSERRRTSLFVAGIVIGAAPAILGSAVLLVSPRLLSFVQSRPSLQATYVLVSYSGLLAIPVVTMYAVLGSRVLGLREVARVSIRAILARQVAYATIAVPLIVVMFLLIGGPEGHARRLTAGLAAFIGGLGVLSLLQRHRILAFVDRHFFPEYPEIDRELSVLEAEIDAAPSLAELAGVIRVGLERSLSLSYACLLTLDRSRSELRALRGETRPLNLSPPQMAELESQRLLRPHTRLGVAAPAWQAWSAETGIELIVAVSSGTDLDALGIGVKRSGMPFIREDETRVVRVADAAARALDRLRSAPVAPAATQTVMVKGRDCLACGKVVASVASLCPACGSDLVLSTLPLTVAGKFRLHRRLGSGGRGIVYQADDLDLDRKVALKAMTARGPRVVALLREEARFMALLDHPGLASILGMEIADGVPVLVLELFENGTLKDRIDRDRLSWREVVAIGLELADALDYLHARQMLHGDVKPSNIGVTNSGRCKLIDFGLGRFLAEDPGTREDLAAARLTGFVTTAGPGRAGTPAYLPPEAFTRPTFEVHDDLWALAMTLFEAIAGLHPYFRPNGQIALDDLLLGRIPDVRERQADCPGPIAEFLQSALSIEMDRRPRTARAFKAELERLHA